MGSAAVAAVGGGAVVVAAAVVVVSTDFCAVVSTNIAEVAFVIAVVITIVVDVVAVVAYNIRSGVLNGSHLKRETLTRLNCILTPGYYAEPS